LLARDGRVHERDRSAISALLARGVHVSLCTGRLYSGSKQLALELGIGGPICCADGSQIVDVTSDQSLVVHTLEDEALQLILDGCRRAGLFSFVLADDEVHHDAAGIAHLPFVRIWSPNCRLVVDLDDPTHWREREVIAVVGLGAAQAVLSLVDWLRQNVPGIQLADFPAPTLGGQSGTHAFIVRRAGISKGTGSAWLARHHGLTLEQVAAVGDWLNDVPMFEVVGKAYAMGQAPEAVRRVASEVLESSSATGGGLAEIVERIGWM
jgi:hydroxymethylpyrimidine pyrophosphatase-like HAD family hydrolase